MTFLLIILTILLFYYLIFLFRIYTGLNQLVPSSGNVPAEYISVIVPFRNEIENILNCLRSLESQNYPAEKFEVIFVNDHSSDNSSQFLKENIKKNNVKTIHLPLSYGQGKKKAVEYGISKSRGEIIVTTDADCKLQPGWLIALLSHFDDKTGMVAGPVVLSEGVNWFEKIQRTEFAGLVTAGAGLIGAGDPYICNAANLSYRKNIFHLCGGFSDNFQLSSGDDEILMQKIAHETEYQIKYCPDKEAMVSTSANRSISQFYNQRKRWGSKGLFYKYKLKIFTLILIFLFYLGMILQLFLSVLYNVFILSFLISLLLKIFSEYLVMKKAAVLLFDDSIMNYFFLTELFHIPYIVIASISGAAGGFKWKNRKLNR